MLWLVFIIKKKPFNKAYLNYQELLNELSLLVVIYICFAFTEINRYSETKYEFGWLMVFLVLANVFCNTLMLWIETIVDII